MFRCVVRLACLIPVALAGCQVIAISPATQPSAKPSTTKPASKVELPASARVIGRLAGALAGELAGKTVALTSVAELAAFAEAVGVPETPPTDFGASILLAVIDAQRAADRAGRTITLHAISRDAGKPSGVPAYFDVVSPPQTAAWYGGESAKISYSIKIQGDAVSGTARTFDGDAGISSPITGNLKGDILALTVTSANGATTELSLRRDAATGGFVAQGAQPPLVLAPLPPPKQRFKLAVEPLAVRARRPGMLGTNEYVVRDAATLATLFDRLGVAAGDRPDVDFATWLVLSEYTQAPCNFEASLYADRLEPVPGADCYKEGGETGYGFYLLPRHSPQDTDDVPVLSGPDDVPADLARDQVPIEGLATRDASFGHKFTIASLAGYKTFAAEMTPNHPEPPAGIDWAQDVLFAVKDYPGTELVSLTTFRGAVLTHFKPNAAHRPAASYVFFRVPKSAVAKVEGVVLR